MTTPTINMTQQDYQELISLLEERGVTVYESAVEKGAFGFTDCESDNFASLEDATIMAALVWGLVVIGKEYSFSPDCGRDDYAAHSGSLVVVTGRVQPAVVLEDSERLFHIQAEDGFVGVAYESELQIPLDDGCDPADDVIFDADSDESPDPVCCPFCSHTGLVNTEVVWRAVSKSEPDNRASLAEYQCRSETCGRSFWL